MKRPLAGRRTIVVSLALAIVAGGCGRRRRASDYQGSNHDEDPGDAVASRPPVTAPRASANANPKTIAAAVLPSVLSVRATSAPGRAPMRTGSGFVIDDKGHILTNAHVVGGAGALTLVLRDGRTVDATIVGTAEAADIAVLRTSAADIPPAALGRSSDLHVGDTVLAVGSPQELAGTVTTGIVSALKRYVALSRSGTRQELIQTDAAVNRGNTGGPLVDGSGQVVGVTTVLATPGAANGDTIGLGFAVPIDRALDIAQDLID